MFIKSVLSKFEWKEEELPDGMTSVFIENLVLKSDTENFAVVRKNKPFFASNFTILSREEDYGFPIKINALKFNGGMITANKDEFVLFRNFKIDELPMSKYINYYSKMIANINEAINQHIDGSKLIATFEVKNSEDKKELETMFKGFSGIKIFKAKNELSTDKNVNITQFEINNQMEVLIRTKHELEKDLSARIGIINGTDKTHQLETNIVNSEQLIDLLNAYELKIRQDFCKRYNKFTGKNLTVNIHKITVDNTIENTGGKSGNDSTTKTDTNKTV